MLKIKKKTFFFSVTEIWFEYKFRLSDLIFPVVYKDIRKLDQKFYFGFKDYDYSVELDLEQPVETILSSFRKRVQTEIRKAENEGVKCYFDNDQDKFILYFNEFAKSKKLEPINKMRLAEMGKYFKISYAELNGEILAAHTYLEDKEAAMVMQFHSASKRFDENFDSSQIARANKFLHLFDMCYFKEQGIRVYDLGAYRYAEGQKGLLEFKQSIGGKEVRRAAFMTYSYYLLFKVQNLLRSLK